MIERADAEQLSGGSVHSLWHLSDADGFMRQLAEYRTAK